jgi:hypothetical protein
LKSNRFRPNFFDTIFIKEYIAYLRLNFIEAELY